jgi:hypothetical protein
MKSYLNELKIAVINGDIDKLQKLIDTAPEYETIEEAQEIVSFMHEAIKLLQKEKNRLSIEMQKIKKLQKFNNEQMKDKQTFNFKA